jgi:hypothetical protein
VQSVRPAVELDPPRFTSSRKDLDGSCQGSAGYLRACALAQQPPGRSINKRPFDDKFSVPAAGKRCGSGTWQRGLFPRYIVPPPRPPGGWKSRHIRCTARAGDPRNFVARISVAVPKASETRRAVGSLLVAKTTGATRAVENRVVRPVSLLDLIERLRDQKALEPIPGHEGQCRPKKSSRPSAGNSSMSNARESLPGKERSQLFRQDRRGSVDCRHSSKISGLLQMQVVAIA